MGFYSAYGKLKRIKQIVEVLTRHQLGFLIDIIGLTRFSSLSAITRKTRKERVEAPHIWARARMVLEDLGGTFIKMGQVLSTRGDILPRELIEELEKLQDQVPPFAFDEVRKTVEKELGIHLEDVFEIFEIRPLASASLGQVHRARLKGGQDVVIKVLRPNMKSSIEIDCNILLDAARFLERRRFLKGRFRFVAIAREIKEFLEEETDYMHEVHNAERFRKNFAQDPSVMVPRIFWAYTSGKVFCMEQITGVKIINTDEIRSMGLDIQEITKTGITVYLKQMLVHGFFHADPHPGNIFVTREGRIAFVDFGLVGELDRNLRVRLADMFIAASRNNLDGVIDALLSMGSLQPSVERVRLRKDLGYIYEKYSAIPIKQINLKELTREILEMTYRHQVKLPPDFTLMIKTLVMLEGLGKQLDPDFNILEAAEPFAKELARERMMSHLWLSDAVKSLQDAWSLMGTYVQQATRTYDALERGDIKIQHEHLGLHKMINRLCFAIVVAAIFLGSSWLIASPTDFAIFGFLGVILAGGMGMLLLFSIIRSGRF